jgi:NADH-quinone oxidoreductase subunit L
VLAGKYYIDELYLRLFSQPLVWISDRVFLHLSDRWLIDGALNGLGALARTSGGLLGRVQGGNLQRYLWFVMIGIVAALVWSWRDA